MNYLKQISKSLLYTFSSLFISIILITILNYFNIINLSILNILKIIIIIISIFIGSFKLGKTSKSKGYLEGLKYGLIFSLLLVIVNLIFYKVFKLKTLIYYIIIIFTSILASTIGINKKKI